MYQKCEIYVEIPPVRSHHDVIVVPVAPPSTRVATEQRESERTIYEVIKERTLIHPRAFLERVRLLPFSRAVRHFGGGGSVVGGARPAWRKEPGGRSKRRFRLLGRPRQPLEQSVGPIAAASSARPEPGFAAAPLCLFLDRLEQRRAMPEALVA